MRHERHVFEKLSRKTVGLSLNSSGESDLLSSDQSSSPSDEYPDDIQTTFARNINGPNRSVKKEPRIVVRKRVVRCPCLKHK